MSAGAQRAVALRDTLLLGGRLLWPSRRPHARIRPRDVPSDSLRLRAYAAASSRYPVVVLHGLTRQGFDDHRLTNFCNGLAASGFIAYTPDLEGLRGLDLDESDIDRISRTIRIVTERHEQSPGLIGFSVGATYGLIAASR